MAGVLSVFGGVVCDNDGRSVGALLGLVLQRLRAGMFLTLARASWTFFR